MPRINDYGTTEIGAQDVPLESSAGLRESGAIGRSIQNFGQVVSEMGDAAYKRAAQTEVSELNANFAEARSDWATKLDEDTRNGTVNTRKAKEQYQEYINKMDSNIQTNEGREFFDRQSVRLGGQIIKSAAHGQAIAAGNKAVADHMSALNTNSNLLQKRPGDFQDVYESSVEAVDSQVNTGVMDAKKGEDLKLATGKELAKNAVRGLIKISPALGKKALDGGEFDKYLDPDAKSALRDHADAEIKSRQDQFEKTLALKDKDPWQFLQKTGQAGAAKPLSLGEDAAESFTARSEFIKEMNKKNGVQLPFMSDHEAEHITKQIMSRPPEEAVAAFNNIDTQVNDQNKSRFAMQVFKKEPGLAAALMISADAPDDTKKVLSGMALLRSGGEGAGKAIRPPPSEKIQEQFDQYIGSSIEDAGTRQAARQAIEAHMVKSMFDRGQSDFGDFAQKDFNESAHAVMGPTVSVGGQRTLSFRDKQGKFLDNDQINDTVDGLTDKTVESVQGDVPRTMSGEPINLEKSRGRLALKAVGDGQYFVYRDSKPAWDKNKRLYILNLKAISKVAIPKQSVKYGPIVIGQPGTEDAML